MRTSQFCVRHFYDHNAMLKILVSITTLSDIITPKESKVNGRTGSPAVFTLQINGKYEGILFEWKFGSTIFEASTHKEVVFNLYPAAAI